MTPLAVVLVVAEIILLVTGQLLFQVAAHQVPSMTTLAGPLALAIDPWFLAALTAYGLAVPVWIALLQRIRLAYAYPMLASAFVLVPTISLLSQGQMPSVPFMIGLVLIVFSFALIGTALPVAPKQGEGDKP